MKAQDRYLRAETAAETIEVIRNAFEGGLLQTVGVNPDGSGYNFRIIDPRQFILTATFDF